MKKLLTIAVLIFSLNTTKTNDEPTCIIPLFHVNKIGKIFNIINSNTQTSIAFGTEEKEVHEIARKLNVAYTLNKKTTPEKFNEIVAQYVIKKDRKKHTCTIL